MIAIEGVRSTGMDTEITPATSNMPAHVHVGVSPTGVTWNVYPKSGETPERLAERVEYARQRLAQLHEKYDTQKVKVSRLTSTGVWYIEDLASLYEGLKADYEAMVTGTTFVVASRRLLVEVVRDMETSLDEDAQSVGDSVNTDRMECTDFAERSARRSRLVAIQRIKYALEGKRQPKRVYVRF